MANWLLLLALILLLPALSGWQNYRRHLANYRAARDRGWRFAPVSARAIIRPHFILAGNTPSGIVWELRRTELRSRFYLEWRARPAALPFGRLLIVPADRPAIPAGPRASLLRAVAPVRSTWPSAFNLLTTHDALVTRFIPPPIDSLLTHFAAWPGAGALAGVDWGPAGLLIHCRYDADWATIDRIIALGSALAAG